MPDEREMAGQRYDVVIIGAGMVGATLACLLRGNGLRVALVEASEPVLRWPGDSVDLRVSAITAASQQIFTRLGVWREMCELGVSPFQEMHVWDASGPGAIHFDCADIGEPRLGHIVENRVIQRALIERLQRYEDVTLYCPARLTGLERTEAAASLRLSDGSLLSARLVVGADGGNSRTRALAGIGTRGWRYDQQAVVAVVSTEHPHGGTAWQRFLPGGPLAFLPLRDGRSSIVWSTRPDHARSLCDIDETGFMNQLGEAFDFRLGRVHGVGPRAAFPLRLQHADTYVDTRLALVGDAAHTIHPLAGQGVNLGLLDAAALAEVLGEAAAAGRDIGARQVLRRFERWRRGENLLMMLAMDGFQRLFGSSLAPVRALRNLGLCLTDGATPLKRRIIHHAMGLSGDLPRLARPARV